MIFCAALLAFASVWPMYQYRPSHNAVFPGPGHAARWTHSFGGKINGGLALVDGVLYVESFDKRITALNARSGSTIWSTKLPNVDMTTPIVADGLVVVGTGTNASELTPKNGVLLWGRPQGDFVMALDQRSGSIVWRYHTTGEDMPSPALVHLRGGDAVVFANGDAHIRALALKTGRLLWSLPTVGIGTMSSAAVSGTTVYVNTAHRLHSVNAQSGRENWHVVAGGSDNSPTLAGGRVFVEMSTTGEQAFSNRISAVDERTGKVLWRWISGDGYFSDTGSNEMSIAGLAAEGLFYDCAQLTDEFVALDQRTGAVRWKLRTASPVKMSAVEKNGRLYFGDTAGYFYVIDARSGRLYLRRKYPKIFTTSSPIIMGNTLYVANDDRVLAMPLP